MLKRLADQFRSDEGGAVALLFALAILPLLAMTGMAIDYARAVSYESQVQTALDAAALNATKALVVEGASADALEDMAKSYFEKEIAGLSGWRASRSDLNVVIDRENGTAKLTVKGKVDTSIGRLVNVDAFDVDVTSTAEYRVKDIELGVMLDVSGSMDGQKLVDLKKAARDMFDELLDNKAPGRKVRIGLAPYSTSINAGSYSAKAKGVSGNAENKCVSERKGKDAFTDEPPSNGKQFGGKPVECPLNTVLPITDDKNALNTSIEGYMAGGATAGHLGIAWAWYLVSPKWASFWPTASAPDPASQKRTVKAVVIMTDGMFNTEYELDDNGTSAEQGLKLCESIKGEDVVVFTVGFQTPPEALPILQECATRSDYAFDAANGDALKKAFGEIARNLNELRVMQ